MHVDVDCQIKDDAAVDMENDLDAFVWSTVFADTGDRDAAASAVDRYHREPSYYMVLVDLMAERRSAYPLPGR